MTVNIGLIGLGMIGRDHLQRFQTVIQNRQGQRRLRYQS